MSQQSRATEHATAGFLPIRARHIFATLCVASGLVSMLSILACESMPMRALRGARHYTDGSEALERGDTKRAIVELERAAELVPQASEIQNHLGLAYWAADQPERARFAFGRALELDCDNTAASRNLAELDAQTAFLGTRSRDSEGTMLEDTPNSTAVGPGDEENPHGG
jgi:tetratricopeptide (TPR) repeat protein